VPIQLSAFARVQTPLAEEKPTWVESSQPFDRHQQPATSRAIETVVSAERLAEPSSGSTGRISALSFIARHFWHKENHLMNNPANPSAPDASAEAVELSSVASIERYLKDRGFEVASTGGGFSWWIKRIPGRTEPWHITVTDWDSDTHVVRPTQPIGVAVLTPGAELGPEAAFEVAEHAGYLPEVLDRLQAAGEELFGTAAKTET